jgi:hypothetical protein
MWYSRAFFQSCVQYCFFRVREMRVENSETIKLDRKSDRQVEF